MNDTEAFDPQLIIAFWRKWREEADNKDPAAETTWINLAELLDQAAIQARSGHLPSGWQANINYALLPVQSGSISDLQAWIQEVGEAYVATLTPIAETLAMLDGNAFFGTEISGDLPWHASYLPEAHAVFVANGGYKGWAGAASFVRHPSRVITQSDHKDDPC